jgi:hypothetical protein
MSAIPDLTGKPVTLVCTIVDAAAWGAENPFRWPDFHGLHLYRIAAFDALDRLDECDARREHDEDTGTKQTELALAACRSILFAAKNAVRHRGEYSLTDLRAAEALAAQALGNSNVAVREPEDSPRHSL